MALLRLSQAAQRLGIAVDTLRRWADRGDVKAVRMPGTNERRFVLEEIERLRAQMRGDGSATVETEEAAHGH